MHVQNYRKKKEFEEEETKKEEEEEGPQKIRNKIMNLCGGEWNPLINIVKGWKLFWKQEVALVSIAFSLLWLTLLSPHDPVLTAYLKTMNYTEWQLGIFRAIGALVGVGGAFIFPYLSAKLKSVEFCSLNFIWEEGIFLIFAGVMFQLSVSFTDLGFQNVFRVFFLVFLVISRFGLYGFEVGEIQLLQKGIAEEVRGRVNSVESSLCNLAMLIVYGSSAVIYKPNWFPGLVWGSIFFIWTACVVYTRWYISHKKLKIGNGVELN